MKSLVLLCLSLFGVALGYDSAALGPTECLTGPAYWCQNLETARRCNAVIFCIQTDWSKSTALTDDNSCKTCEKDIQIIKDSIGSNTTKTVLEDLLDSICRETPAVLVYKTCLKIIHDNVDTYFNELLDLLSSSVSPATICRIFQLCTRLGSSDVTEVIAKFSNVVLHFPAETFSVPTIPSSLRVNEGCTWRTDFVCQNLTNSKKCSMTQDCIEIWKDKEFPEDNDSVCQVCKDMVKQARDQLLSNETQEELKEVFEGSCRLIHIKPIVKECIELADDFIPQLTEVLASEMNPTAVCTVAGLCNSERIDNLLSESKIQSLEPKILLNDTCWTCDAAIFSIKYYTQSKIELFNFLNLVCGEMSSYSDSCSYFVGKNIDYIYDKIKSVEPYVGCHLLGMCPQKYHFHTNDQERHDFSEDNIKAMMKVKDDLPCELCEQLVLHFKQVLTLNTTEDEFHQVLEGFCKQMKGSLSTECLSFVNDNFAIIYQFLTEELVPEKICKEVNLCPKAKMISAMSTSHVDIGNPLAQIENSECQICKLVVKYIQTRLKDNATEEEIRKILDETCTVFPSKDKKTCENFINSYYDQILNILTNGADPEMICALIGTCDQGTRRVNNVKNKEVCTICQYVLHYIQEELDKEDVDRDITHLIEKVCNIIPAHQSQGCRDFIEQYADLIISALEQEIDPSLVCPQLKLCPGDSFSKARCSGCINVMGKLISAVGDDRKYDNVVEKMSKMLSSMPYNLVHVGFEMQLNNKDDIVDMITAEFNAEESCWYLKYCNSMSIAPMEKFGLTSKPSVVDNPECEFCESFVRIYEKRFLKNSTEAEVEAELEKYCDKIKDLDVRKNCVSVVKKYVPKLMVLLEKDASPKEVCSLLKLCPALRLPSLKQQIEKFGPLQDEEKCTLCETLVGAVEGVAGDPYLVDDAVERLERVCNLVEAKHRGVCMEIVDQLAPQILMIPHSIPSWYYCSKLKVCPYSEEMQRTGYDGAVVHIEDDDCAVGESFWCKTVHTAASCDKIERCLEVWA